MAPSKRRRSPSPRQTQPARPEREPAVHVPAVQVPINAPLDAPVATEDVHKLVREHTETLLDQLESIFGCPVLAYFLGEGAAIADEQMLHLYEHLRRIGSRPTLALWISSRGGATEVPVKIVSLLREYSDRFIVLVPYRAHSAATQIALGADEIVMTPMAELGPVDPSRRHPLLPREAGASEDAAPIPISVQDLRHVVQFVEREVGGEARLTPEAAATVYTAIFDKVHPLAIGALEQTWALSQQVCQRVLSTHMDPDKEADKIKAIVDRLSDFYKSHLYQIDRGEAKEIGLKVRDATDEEAEAMWALLLAFNAMQVGGEGELGGQPALVTRLGHITSKVGSTIGIGLALTSDPGTVAATRWESRWWAAPAGAPPETTEGPPPGDPAARPPSPPG